MAYQVLARKWRPKSFAQLVGQEHVIKALANAFANDRLHHAYLLTGTRGVGKTTIARIMAKALNCETGVTATPCGVCPACMQIDAGRFVDLLEIDAASNTGIDNIREVLDNAQYSPTAGRFKVYIIDEVHMLSKSAFNAMLKTLEEPPAHVKFILATTDPQKVPITVLSRCLQFSLRQMTPQQVSGHLTQVLQAEEINFEQSALNILGHAANGSMRDALSLLDQAIAYGGGDVGELAVRAMLGAVDQSYLFDILQALIAGDGNAVLATADAIAGRGLSYESALHELAHLLHQVAVAQAVPKALADDLPQREQIAGLAQVMSPEDTQLYYQIALHGRRDLPLAPDEYAGFSMTLLRMLAFSPAEASQINLPAQAVSPAARAAPVTQAVPQPAPNPPAQQQAAPRPPISDEPSHYDAPPWHEEERAAPPAQAPAAIAAPATKGPFNGDWRALILQLKLGAAGMLAQNAELLGYTANSIELLVGEEHTAVASRAYQEKLREALSNHFGHEISLSITLGSASGDTPAAIALREKLARLAEATQSIQNDPFVQSVVRDFGATVIPDSIKPLS
ncbi:DNA polymerase III subunit gamma/tau [Iodobacter fluviatilis]|uniref:DNA polymerase III subunit gamma/tau n=1 Tax=Iodobacter fluviatilis TaxID=537 RepID=A0A377Q7G0_9NEIS|nr:DNA polymerase III subunit gamma/tau [Iodobacter fluviatilis]TCU89289.1 DNA polymerase-3 subunit gamma/tau [Iodobacter fluviatilis]STQ90658.1 DNA polymerase III subunit tau [Iodobacter fluviatilis]